MAIKGNLSGDNIYRRKPLVLVVVKSAYVAKDLMEILIANGYDVIVARNGKAAHNKLKEHTPDIILMDVFHSGLEGFVLYKQIRELSARHHFPVLAITLKEKLESLFRNFVVEGFITKPFGPDKLLAEIQFILTGRAPKSASKKNIAIVDDDPQVLAMLTSKFKEQGFTVNPQNSGLEAIIEIYENPAELVIVNLGLKELAGDLVAFHLNYMMKTSRIPVMLYCYRTNSLDYQVISRIKHKSGVVDLIIFDDIKDIIERVEHLVANL